VKKAHERKTSAPKIPGFQFGVVDAYPAPARKADSQGTNPNGFWYGVGYDATHHKGKRAMPHSRVLSEDLELRDLARRQLSTSIRDLNRNFSIVAWAVRRHLDFVSTFHLRFSTGDKVLDKELADFMDWYAKPENCDAAGRHSLPRLLRMWESRRTIDGDVLINKLQNGKIQTVEGDRIQTFGGIPFTDLGIDDPMRVVNGVYINEMGKALSYMVFKRLPLWTGLRFDRALSAKWADLLGYFERYDQVRGISPISSAANMFRDIYEAGDLALAKMKVSQLFAAVTTRTESDELGTEEEREGDANPNQSEGEGIPRKDVDFGAGPVMLDLDLGEDMKVIESQQPSEQFQNFAKLGIMIALKSIDLPFSFFDESHTNYSGSRMAGMQYYEGACKIKQHDLRLQMDRITRWRLGLAIADADIEVPAKMIPNIKWEWTHAGIPLYDPLKETSATIAAINSGTDSEIRACKRLGLDFFQIIDERKLAQDYAKKAGVVLSTALASVAQDDPNKAATQKEDVTEAEEDLPGKKNSDTNGDGYRAMSHARFWGERFNG
jgi:capsid protein